MGSLSYAKNFGGAGSVLILIGAFVPHIGFALQLLGFVLVLLAVKEISEVFEEGQIFRDYLVAFGFITAAILFAGFVLVGAFLTALMNPHALEKLLTGFIVAVLLFWILMVAGAVYLRRSFKTIARLTGVGMFETTGTVYLIGAVLTIIFVGLLVVLLAVILQIVAFFSLSDAG